MTAAIQGDLWGPPPVDVDAADASTDSYCTPPEVMDPVREAAGGTIALDPWTNSYAIAHGWVRARTAWTIGDGHYPEREIDPYGWPLRPGEFVWGNPPYSNPLPFVLRFIHEVTQARAWGMLLLKSDSRTRWAAALLDRRQPIALWQGPISFYHLGQRAVGNNFASTLYVVDGTGTSSILRAKQLAPIFEGKAWVYP